MAHKPLFPSPPRAAGIAPFRPDPTVESAQRDFLDSGPLDKQFHAAAPAWALKPNETVCSGCWLVQPCECDD